MGNAWHVNDEGVPSPCAAKAEDCAFSGSDEHFATEQEARNSYEAVRNAVPELWGRALVDGLGSDIQLAMVTAPLSIEMEEMLSEDEALEGCPSRYYHMGIEDVIDEIQQYEWEAHLAEESERELYSRRYE